MKEQRDLKKAFEGKPGEEGREGSHIQSGFIMLKIT
jgi:hypothetical protein